MSIGLTQAEQLYKDERYEEALQVIEEAIRIGGSHPDSSLYSFKATILERLAQHAYETAKRGEYKEDKQEETDKSVDPLEKMSLTVVADRCMGEIEKYRHKEPYNDHYCLEIFHRVTLKHDPDALELLQQRFSPLVRAWMHNFPQRDAACRYQSEEDYVAETFVRLWQASTRDTLEFDSMAAALRYLKLCLQGTIMDGLRAYSRSKEEPLPNPSFDIHYTGEPETAGGYEDSEWWATIKSMIPNERESRLAYLLFACGLKPREIVKYNSDEFRDIQEIYRLRRSITDRLLRNSDYLRWRLA